MPELEIPPLAYWLSTISVIFAIVDPFGYIPIFISMTARDSEDRRRHMLGKACLTAGIVLTVFTLVGTYILQFFGISIPALQITGGLLLLVIGFEMLKVLPIGEKLSAVEENEGVNKEDISIVPLAIPMLSGPASIATVVVLAADALTPEEYAVILFSVVLTLGVTYLVLRSATRILNYVGVTGLNVVTRIMGLLLCAMAVQFVIDGYLSIH